MRDDKGRESKEIELEDNGIERDEKDKIMLGERE